MEHGYRQTWQRYARGLRQRNAALRMNAPAGQVSAWDRELVDAGGELDRSAAVLEPVLEQVQQVLGAAKPAVVGEIGR